MFYEQLKAEEGHLRYEYLTNGKLLRMLYVVADILEPLAIITKNRPNKNDYNPTNDESIRNPKGHIEFTEKFKR